MSASTTVLDLGDKASALEDKGLSSSEIAQNPRSEVLAAAPYGDAPVAAAAANGWRATVVEDTATSKKHPARFAVLTRTIDRARRGGTGRSEERRVGKEWRARRSWESAGRTQ